MILHMSSTGESRDVKMFVVICVHAAVELEIQTHLTCRRDVIQHTPALYCTVVIPCVCFLLSCLFLFLLSSVTCELYYQYNTTSNFVCRALDEGDIFFPLLAI